MKESIHQISRRNFVNLAATALVSVPLRGFEPLIRQPIYNMEDNPEVYLFSKHLQFLNYEEMSEAAAEMEFNGLDLTLRPKGHVLPERVKDDLPRAAAAMRKFGLQPKLMTTNVLDAKDNEHQQVLETAGKLGFSHYRTGWLTYPEERSIAASQKLFGQQFKALEQLNKTFGLVGCYQNHAGNHVGAPIWDLPPILEFTNNENFGCQYDIRHAVVEGGLSWELGLRLIHPYIKSIVVKDFKWAQVNGSWKLVNTPLGDGMINFRRYFSLLKKYQIKVPISLHLEYELGGAEHGASKINIDKNVIFKQMKKDLAYLKETWANAE